MDKKCLILNILITLFLQINGQSDWWKTMSVYQIYTRSFKDSNDDGIGDLLGIENKLQHIVDSKFDAFLLSSIYHCHTRDYTYDIDNYDVINEDYGTMQDFEFLLQEAHKLSLKVIIDFVPNHTSDEHIWFQASTSKEEPYTNYYIWHPGKIVNGTRYPPNNWLSRYHDSAWTWNDDRKEYYYHQFSSKQPDLNYRNNDVIEDIRGMMRFYLDMGVDGFRMILIDPLVEDTHFYDEPFSSETNDSNNYQFLNHIYTNNQVETYEMVQVFREVIDEYILPNDTRVLMVDTYSKTGRAIDYYCYGANFPLNFRTFSLKQNFSAEDIKSMIDNWINRMPIGRVPNWVTGNYDVSRLASRFERQYALCMIALMQLLPGVAIVYSGDEIGMENTMLSWEATKDAEACKAGKNLYQNVTRDPYRTPFQWDASVSAGFSKNKTTWLPVNPNYKQINLAAQKKAEKSFYKDYLKIANLRKLPVIKKGSLVTKLLSNNVFAFSREIIHEKSVYVVLNTSYESETVSLQYFQNAPLKVKVYLALSTASNIKDGEVLKSDKIHIGPRSCLILTMT